MKKASIPQQSVSSDKKMIRQFLALPVVLGSLLLVTGITGMYVNWSACRALFSLNNEAFKPALDLDKITKDLEMISKTFIRLNQGGLSPKVQTEMMNETKNSIADLDQRIKYQILLAKGLSYEPNFLDWSSKWFDFRSNLEPKLGSFAELEPNLSANRLAISDLVEKTSRVSEVIQNNVSDRLEDSMNFSIKAKFLLAFTLFAGLVITALSSAIIIRSLKNLLLTIASGKKSVETLLNNLDQGFIVFDKSGTIDSGVSKAAIDFLGMDPTGRRFFDVLPGLDEKGRLSIKGWIDLIFGGSLRFSDFEPLAPKFFEYNNRFIELEFKPIFASGSETTLDRVICVASDKTDERFLRKHAEAEAALVKLAMIVLTNRGSFADFVKEIRKNLAEISADLAKPVHSLNRLLRAMHSIKGGASSFHMPVVGRLAHRLESQLADCRILGPDELQRLIPTLIAGTEEIKTEFEGFLKRHEHILGTFGNVDDRVREVSVQSINHICRLMFDQLGTESKAYRDYLEEFVLEDLGLAFRRFDVVISNLAERQMKKIDLNIEMGKAKVLIEPYLPLITSYIHVFRNAVDHGIETTQVRTEVGKPERGSISVRFERNGQLNCETLRIITEDDGRGIDPAVVRKKAIERGLLSENESLNVSDEDILKFLFVHGFSTREEVTDISGRGVGADAVKLEAEKLGGKVWYESSHGKGTRFILEVPLFETPDFVSSYSVPIKKAADF